MLAVGSSTPFRRHRGAHPEEQSDHRTTTGNIVITGMITTLKCIGLVSHGTFKMMTLMLYLCREGTSVRHSDGKSGTYDVVDTFREPTQKRQIIHELRKPVTQSNRNNLCEMAAHHGTQICHAVIASYRPPRGEYRVLFPSISDF